MDRAWENGPEISGQDPEVRKSGDSGVRGTGWLQMFRRLDIESDDGQR
jgi:hypothetical protein